MKNSSYWLEGLSFDSPKMPLEGSCDVVIIGGGFTGLSAGLALARAGRSVVVLERGPIGGGATTRNAGQTLAGLKLSAGQLIEKYGREQAVELYRASLTAIDYVENFIGREKINCHFHRFGALWAAYAPGHFTDLERSQKLLAEVFNHQTHLVPPERMKEELGSSYYHGGLIDPISAGLHPGKLAAGLCERAVQAGARIHDFTEVTSVSRTATGFRVQIPQGDMNAREILLASNGYTPDFLPTFRRRVIPIGSYILVTEPLEASVAAQLIPNGRMVFDTKKFLFYFRLTPDRRLLFGGRTSFARMADAQAAKILRQSMREVFPQLREVSVSHFWSGYVGFTFDQMPHLGKMEGLHYALGYCGHGVAPSLYFGNAIANMIDGKQTDVPFARLAFQARFYYLRRPWFLPLAGSYYRCLDRLARLKG